MKTADNFGLGNTWTSTLALTLVKSLAARTFVASPTPVACTDTNVKCTVNMAVLEPLASVPTATANEAQALAFLVKKTWRSIFEESIEMVPCQRPQEPSP